MKKFFTLFLQSFVFFLIISNQSKAQDVYWREGFEGGTISTVTPNPTSGTIGPISYWGDGVNTLGAPGGWYMYGTYRTTGTACPTIDGVAAGLNHIRFKSNAVAGGLNNFTDSPYIITPIVDYGIKELHFTRTRATRYFYYYTTTDTSATTTNWVFLDSTKSSANTCADTLINVNRPTARRLKIKGRAGTDTDIDSIWLVSSTPIPVPVRFNGISAAFINGMVKVDWLNETEISTIKYEIERSDDGINFSVIGSISANNNRKYSWFDLSPKSGISYYRVKGIDNDGRRTYSTIVQVKSNKANGEVVVKPNPVSGGVMNVQLNNLSKGVYNLHLISNAGQVVFSTKMINQGASYSNSITLPSSVSTGMYKLQVEGENNFKTTSSIIIR